MHPIKVTSRLGNNQGFSNGIVAFFDCYDQKLNKDVKQLILSDKSIKLMF